MLLAAERREATRGGRTSETGLLMAFNFLGGKRDSVSERPRAVAARECWEETGEQLSAAARKRLETTAQPVAWAWRSKYALFLHELGDEDATLAERVASLGGPPNIEHDPNLLRVAWVPLRRLLSSDWLKAELHAFAREQAHAILPAVRQLLSERFPDSAPLDVPIGVERPIAIGACPIGAERLSEAAPLSRLIGADCTHFFKIDKSSGCHANCDF